MSKQLNREEAWALLTEYNQDPFHLHHARTVEGVMRYFAQELGYGDEWISGASSACCMIWILSAIPISTASSRRRSCASGISTSG